MNDRIEFWCAGMPAPQGSKRAMTNRKTGQAFLIEDSKRSRPWRKAVATAARAAVAEQGAIVANSWRVEMAFFFERPKSHLRANGELRKGAPSRPTGRGCGDLDKLFRCVGDAITNIAIGDDVEIVSSAQDKFYTRRQAGVRVVVKPATKGNHHE